MAFADAPRCTHIKIDGCRCGSPALRGEFFCYFHANLIKGLPGRVDARLDSAAMFESPEHLQYSLMQVFDRITKGEYDHRRASLILRTLNLAFLNSRRTDFNADLEDLVPELPDYNRQYLAEHPEHCSPEDQTKLQALRRQFHLKVKVDPTPAPSTSTPEPQAPPHPQPPPASSIKPVIPPQNGNSPKPEVKSNVPVPAPQAKSQPSTHTPSAPPPPSPRKASPASSASTPTLPKMPATPLTERQATQWKKVKQLHALAKRANHGDMDITTLASSLHRILLDPKPKAGPSGPQRGAKPK